MNITSESVDGFQIIKVCDARIDAAAAIQFKDQLRQLTQTETADVILDLSSVDFVDSSGLGAIVAVKKNLGTDRPMSLAGLTPIVAKVFALTRMDKVFAIYATPAEALDGDDARRA